MSGETPDLLDRLRKSETLETLESEARRAVPFCAEGGPQPAFDPLRHINYRDDAVHLNLGSATASRPITPALDSREDRADLVKIWR